MEGSGDALPLAAEQLHSFGFGEPLVQLLEFGDHLALTLVQPGVVDSDGDLTGEG